MVIYVMDNVSQNQSGEIYMLQRFSADALV